MRLTCIVATTLLLAATQTFAQQSADTLIRRPPGSDPVAANLFPPELIMAHQRELGLEERQRATITSEIQKAQSQFIELQWRMSDATEHLAALLRPSVVNEAEVLEQVDRTLAVEREIKRIQVALLIRIKNALTASQQTKLAELRGAETR